MVTQKDIAARVGVSVSLVSRALSGTAESIGVPTATIERVRAAAGEMGYTPNAAARILKGAQARTFGVVVYDFEDPFFGPIVGELQRLAHEQSFSLVLGGFEKRRIWDLDVSALLSHRIDGLIIIGSGDAGWTGPFLDKDIPLVRIGSGPMPKGLHTVEVDDRKGIQGLVAHLLSIGRTRIGFIGAEQASHQRRADYFKQAMRASGLRIAPRSIVFSDARLADAGYDAGKKLLASPAGKKLDAIMAGSDLIALGLLRALKEADRSVPGQIAVTGYDDIPAARLAVPSLTTVRQPVAGMARAAFGWILNPERHTRRRTVFAPELKFRESTRILG